MAIDRLELEYPRQIPFSETARAVLTYAEEEARRLNHLYVGSEHVLLGLTHPIKSAQEGQDPQLSPAGQVLTEGGVTLHRARQQVEFMLGKGDRLVQGGGQIYFTPSTRAIIESATQLAQTGGRNEVTEMDLLRGIMNRDEGIACSVIESLAIAIIKKEGSTTIQRYQTVKLPA